MGYIYLIGSKRYGWYKIGKSSRPYIRIKELGILLPFSLEILGIWKVPNHHLLETDLHKKFKKFHINGEWFSFPRNRVEDFCKDMDRVAFSQEIPKSARLSAMTPKERRASHFRIIFEAAKASYLEANPEDRHGAIVFARAALDKAKRGELASIA